MNTPPLERALAAGGWAFLARTLVGASGFARTLVLARLLSPHDFGLMATAFVILGAVETFTGTGFETALEDFVNPKRARSTTPVIGSLSPARIDEE